MFVTEHVRDSGDALGLYRDVILRAFDSEALEQVYSDSLAVTLAHDVYEHTDLNDLIQQILQNCANQGAHLSRFLVRVVRARAARRELVAKLAPALGLQPLIEIADLLVRRGCPDALRDDLVGAFEATGAHRKAYHARGREAWIDVLVWLEELPESGQGRPPVIEFLERVERAWRKSNVAGASALADVLDSHRAAHDIGRPIELADVRVRPVAAADCTPATRCSLPIALLPAKQAPMIGTDTGEWFTIEPGDQLAELPASGPFSAAIVDPSGIVAVACWKGSIKQLRGRVWEEHGVGATPLALAVTEHGVVAGDTAGQLTLVALGGRARGGELAIGAPVLELGVAGASLVMIDACGVLTATSLPLRGQATLVVLDTAELGRPLALYQGVRSATLFVLGERGIATTDGATLGRVVAVAGVRTVAAFRGHDRACVVVDGGAAWIVDASLARVASIRLIGASIDGAVAGADGNVLAWTTRGDLHSIAPDGSVLRLTEGDVVLAAPDRDDASGYIAVHWTAAGGPRVSRGRSSWI